MLVCEIHFRTQSGYWLIGIKSFHFSYPKRKVLILDIKTFDLEKSSVDHENVTETILREREREREEREREGERKGGREEGKRG